MKKKGGGPNWIWMAVLLVVVYFVWRGGLLARVFSGGASAGSPTQLLPIGGASLVPVETGGNTGGGNTGLDWSFLDQPGGQPSSVVPLMGGSPASSSVGEYPHAPVQTIEGEAAQKLIWDMGFADDGFGQGKWVVSWEWTGADWERCYMWYDQSCGTDPNPALLPPGERACVRQELVENCQR